MPTIPYFAYGSNLLTRRLRGRVPSAQPLGRAILAGHRLAWHKVGKDGSGKCDIAPDPGPPTMARFSPGSISIARI